jgi:hypothetical protein
LTELRYADDRSILLDKITCYLLDNTKEHGSAGNLLSSGCFVLPVVQGCRLPLSVVVNQSPVKNAQGLDWESETGALGQLSLPESACSKGYSLHI